MGFLKNLFNAKQEHIATNEEFWAWFETRESEFAAIIGTRDSKKMEQRIFGPLSEKLEQLRDGIFFQMGMADESTAELVLTPEGNAKNVGVVEELIAAAPSISGWLFTALKRPESSTYIEMNGLKFGIDTLKFYPNDHESMPDLVDITIVHDEFDGGREETIKHGSYLFLDNYLGELSLLENIDELSFVGPSDAAKDLIPLDALENFLQTRQALFVEKYEGVRIFTENDNYSIMEAKLESGRTMVATINTDLLKWDRKASHPWMLVMTIGFNGNKETGLPDNATAEKLNKIEDALIADLKDADGYLNIGRQAANGERHIFFACVEFRKPSRVAHSVQQTFGGSLAIDYRIYKDKYWQTVSHFSPPGDDN